MSALVDYLNSLDRTQAIVHATVAIGAILGLGKIFGSGDATRKMLEQQKKPQSVEVSTALPGEGPIHRHVAFKDALLETLDPKVRTLFDLFSQTCEKYGNAPYLGTRKKTVETVGDYVWETYAEVKARRDNFGSGIVTLTGHKPDDPIGIYSINRSEWLITDLACSAYRWPSVSLYDTLGQNAVEFIIRHAEIKLVVCAVKQLQIIFSAAKNCPMLKTVITMDPFNDAQEKEADSLGLKILYMKDVEEVGKKTPKEYVLPFPETVYTIMYTSGTTGDPKGVILTHANAISEIAAVTCFNGSDTFFQTDIHISYLPLAHSFERCCVYIITSCGAQIGFYQGNINELFNDIATLRPTFLIGAPRVWSRLYDKLTLTIDNGPTLKKKMFWWGFAAKQAAFKKGLTTSALWDKLVFSKTKARIGGRVRFILSGSAPLDVRLAEFLRICFCCTVIEGYGLTENFAGSTISALDDTQLGHVGKPLPCNEIKLVDVPEMNYLSKNTPQTGEIMLRGHNVFKGYYKDIEKTKEALEPDGWFHTGDIGKWNENGTLSIIDRKKNIFKLSQGEYVAVEYLEGVFVRSQFVKQIWVYGNSFKRYLVAVAVPDEDFLPIWAKQNSVEGDYKSLCANPKVKAAIVADLEKVGKEAKLNGFEFVKSVLLDTTPFSVDNDLMTPTFKLRRVNLLKYYKDDINKMYVDIGEGPLQ